MESGGSHDNFETRYWLRTAAAGGWVTILMSLAGLLYLMLFSPSSHRLGLGLMLAVALICGLLALFVLPWRRVVASPWRGQAFLGWGLSTVVMIWLAALIDGGGDSPLQVALFLPVVFASLSFPVRYVIATGVLAEVAFLSLALEGGWAVATCSSSARPLPVPRRWRSGSRPTTPAGAASSPAARPRTR